MNIKTKILRDVPLFRHCTDDEIIQLQNMSRMVVVKKGQLFDLKKLRTFNVIIDGIFEIEALGKTDIVYLAPGSFFGNVPFTNNKLKGTIRAMVDSNLLLIEIEDLYRFFLVSYKCLRGYLNVVGKLGFEISSIGEQHFENKTKIITVYSESRNSGKTFLTSLLGTGISKEGKTVLLDVSYDGNSLFNYFQKKVTSPIAQIHENNQVSEAIINERLEVINENLHLLNVSYGSKVRVDGDILPPLLFVLSREYKYIVLDVSASDSELRNKSFAVSDIVFCLLKNKKETDAVYSMVDETLRDGQRAFYIVNEFYSKRVTSFAGGLLMDSFSVSGDIPSGEELEKFTTAENIKNMVYLVQKKKRALVVEPNYLESIFLSGFFSVMKSANLFYDFIYTSSLSYIILAINYLSRDTGEYKKTIVSFFSEERINSFLDITFPNEFIFKKNSIGKFAAEISGKNRIESYSNCPMVMVSENGANKRTMYTTGFFRDLISTSFILNPLFEPNIIGENVYNSGFPSMRAAPEDLFRTDVDEITFLSVNNKGTLQFPGDRVLPFFREYIGLLGQKVHDDKFSELADNNLTIDISEKELKPDKIFKLTENISNKLLKDKKLI